MADLMMNEEIRDREVRVIDQNGEQLGVQPIRKALELAEEAGLDLVKIVPTAKPPVCKLMDYDKYRYEQAKKEREIRRNQKVVSIKEVQLSATIEENDIQTKAKAAVKFLQGGDKVKVSIRFRGRQITHQEIGLAVMQDFVTRVKDVAVVDSTSSGSRMSTSRISPASSFLLTSWGLMRGSMIDSRLCRARGPGHAALPLRTKGRTIFWYCVPACRSSSCCCSFSGRCSCFCCDCFS